MSWIALLTFLFACAAAEKWHWPPLPVGQFPDLPPGGPQPAPPYMVDNRGNYFGAAPDKGTLNGPVTTQANLTDVFDHKKNKTLHQLPPKKRQTSDYWLGSLGDLGSMPLAPSGYQVFRNVQDYGATGLGQIDDVVAINLAVTNGSRCGSDCGSTTTLGAVIYFPYYYTVFLGDPNNPPTIRGCNNFTGIALIDTDVYIPGGNGSEWYINQDQFYRQIRNFIFDLTEMNATNSDNDQLYYPTGIHWQVAQASSLQNLVFNMATSTDTQAATAVGIFMENGSGGFVSDLTFYGGNIGFRAGSQQYTARNLVFTNCLTAISMVWDWGFTWQQITVNNCWIAIDATASSGSTGQGTGSLSVVDSTFLHVPYAITLRAGGPTPSIVLDNLFVQNSASVVLISGGATIFPGSSGDLSITSWAYGRRYVTPDGLGETTSGLVTPAPNKPASLLDSTGKYFVRSKPQYETIASGTIIVATDHGIANDGTGNQTGPINSLLASSVGTPVFFPAGIYQVQGTVFVPVNSIIVGEAWSQIMGTGSYFEDQTNPQVMVKIGNPGDSGIIEISDMLFTVKGPTAGAILVEWNVHESTQGSAAMWDSHFRVGGAAGTDLQLDNCPAGAGFSDSCMAASLLFHITSEASGYFENVWAWVADHDLDSSLNPLAYDNSQGVPLGVQTDISIYAGRGILVESQGPTWMYGTASEHSVLYQYQLNGAKNIYLGHMQTESPYFQPDPTALSPYDIGQFPQDPTFDQCSSDYCEEAWALRMVDSSDVFIYSAGFYSWFSNYGQGCLPSESCQEKIMETSGCSSIWVFNIFTKGVVEIASPAGGVRPIFVNDSNQSGYTSEISVWLPLAGSETESNETVIYVDPTIWVEPQPTIQGTPPCILVLPPSVLTTTTTITFPLYTTTLEVGWITTVNGETSFTAITTTTTLTIPPVTTTAIPFWNVNVTSGESLFTITPTTSILPTPFTITDQYPAGVTASPEPRVITPPPYPYSVSPGGGTSNNNTQYVATTSFSEIIIDGSTVDVICGEGFKTVSQSGLAIEVACGTIVVNGQTQTAPSSPTTTSGVTIVPPLVYFTTFPSDSITPVTTPVPSPTTTVINGKTEPVIPCTAWFFFICISNEIGGIILSGWLPGIYPPGGPPPCIGCPPGIEPPDIEWPDITIGYNNVPTYDPMDDDEPCETSSTSVCGTTISYGVDPTGSTTATVTTDICETVFGCEATGTGTTTTITGSATAGPTPWVVYPQVSLGTVTENINTQINALGLQNVYRSYSTNLGTAFWFIPAATLAQAQQIAGYAGVSAVNIPAGAFPGAQNYQIIPVANAPTRRSAPDEPPGFDDPDWPSYGSESHINRTRSRRWHEKLQKRGSETAPDEMVFISQPPGVPLDDLNHIYAYDDSLGEGVTMYLSDFGWQANTEFANLNIQPIRTGPNTLATGTGDNAAGHGTCMISKMAGATLGVARKANVYATVMDRQMWIYENYLDGLWKIYDNIIATQSTSPRNVVNMPWNFPLSYTGQDFVNKVAYVLGQFVTENIFISTGAGNRVGYIDGYPALFRSTQSTVRIPNLLVVGNVQNDGMLTLHQSLQPPGYLITETFAPGVNVGCANLAGGVDPYGHDGTSISTSTTAGLAAYYWALNPGMSAVQIKSLVVSSSHSRPAVVGAFQPFPSAIYNGENPELICNNNAKRQDGPIPAGCTIGPTATEGSGSGHPLTFSSGPPSPVCTSGCGILCSGTAFCSAPCLSCYSNPTQAPDFLDPLDPNSPENPANPSYIGGCVTTTVVGSDGSSTEQCVAATTPTPTTSIGSSSVQVTTPPPTSTTTSSPQVSSPAPSSTPATTTFTAGVAIAAYTICQIEVCEYQWEVFNADPPQYTYPGCSTDGALWSSVVTTIPQETAIPTVGPFDTHGYTGCTFSPDTGLSCVPDAECNLCPIGPDGVGLCVGDGEVCNEDETEGYNTEAFCQW